MTIRTIGVLAPGEMGQAVGRVLREGDLQVITCLAGRSARTIARASAAGMIGVPDDAALVREADLLLAILPPAAAREVAERIATVVRSTRADLTYVDCNAIAPQTSRDCATILLDAGARYIDAGIIGGPPVPGRPGPRLYVSGPDATTMLQLRAHGLDVRVAGAEVGQASGLKLCYATLTKGLTALATEALVAGHALGLGDILQAELCASQRDVLAWIDRTLPGMPPKAWRWIGEMEEIAAMFRALGLPPEQLSGAAAVYRFVSQAMQRGDPPQTPPAGKQTDGVVAQLAAALSAPTMTA
jgi:3-hydroxyisobutyrate dehydrogenase-like beta-hydroxyacid dehydrogenase